MFKEVYRIGVYIIIVIWITDRHLLQQFVSVFRDTSFVCPVVVCIPVDECSRSLSLYLTVVQFLVCVCVCVVNFFFFFGPMELRPNASCGLSSFLRFLDHTRRTTVGRTPLYEWSAPRRDLYLTTYNTDNRQTCMTPAGFEPTFPASERSQTYTLNLIEITNKMRSWSIIYYSNFS